MKKLTVYTRQNTRLDISPLEIVNLCATNEGLCNTLNHFAKMCSADVVNEIIGYLSKARAFIASRRSRRIKKADEERKVLSPLVTSILHRSRVLGCNVSELLFSLYSYHSELHYHHALRRGYVRVSESLNNLDIYVGNVGIGLVIEEKVTTRYKRLHFFFLPDFVLSAPVSSQEQYITQLCAEIEVMKW